MRWPKACLGDVAQVVSGATPKSSFDQYWDGDIPWITPADLSKLEGKEVSRTSRRITQAGLSSCSSRILPPRSVLFSSRAPIGHVAINTVPMATNQGFKSFVPDQEILSPDFLYWWLKSNKEYLQGLGRGATFKEVSKEIVESIEIPLPPLEEQRRIAAILDKANGLIRLRSGHQALSREIELSVFYNEFGSPVANPFGWPMIPLAEMAEIFSDGPFGSNLKSSHYVDSGIRVVRLQNIGVGIFLDDDRAYVSPSHYETIKKHSCLPGDVMIGTLGDPNLRACILPSDIPVGINKADCIQMRCDKTRCIPKYVSHLLNLPETNQMASTLVLGQTRGRISMGRLKGLEVPIPPLENQIRFAKKIDSLGSLRRISASSASSLRDLVSSFSSAVFALERHQ